MVELWREEVVERSWSVLRQLHELARLVVIGGWGVYFWTKKLKSRDVDVCIDQANFYKLQSTLLEKGIIVKRNPRLKKFEAIVENVEVDIYTPFMSNLVVPCLDILSGDFISNIEGFNVAIPEILLLLKAQAAEERWNSEKGMKDRIDIISLLAFADLKPDLLKKLAEKYDINKSLRRTITRTLRECRAEYKILGLSYQKDGVKLRRLFEEIFR